MTERADKVFSVLRLNRWSLRAIAKLKSALLGSALIKYPHTFSEAFCCANPTPQDVLPLRSENSKALMHFWSWFSDPNALLHKCKKNPVPWSSEFFRNLGFKMGWILRTQRRAEDKVYGVDLQTSESEAETQQRVVVEMDEERKVWKWKQAIKFPDSLDIWELLEKRYGYD